ncbi:MAG: hypothetical protein J5I90_16095 [Caldilineales bacterium]|nr:hypothetical protein [Caldilineales bacterium]
MTFDPTPYLEQLEMLVDADHVRAAEARQSAAWRYEPVDRRPTIITVRDDWGHKQYDVAPGWPQIPYSEAYRDPAKMLIYELTRVYEGALLKDDRSYTIRSNYGLVLLASMVGCPYWQDQDNMPWAEAVATAVEVEAILDRGLPDMSSGLAGQVWETELYFRETLAQYPRLSQTVRIGCPDAQGPFNTAVNIAGVQVYMEVIKQPDLIHRLMAFSTELYLAVIAHHKKLMDEPEDVGYSFSYRIDGGGRASDDSAVMMSSKMYGEFVKPYNAQAYQNTHGGLLHFCGRGDQFYEHMVNTPGVSGINFGNPEMQDFVARYELAEPRKICLLWDGDLPPELDHITTGVVHKRIARSWDQAEAWARELPVS